MSNGKGRILKDIPSVTQFLESDQGHVLRDAFGSAMVKFMLRDQLDCVRREILSGTLDSVPSLADVAQRVETEIVRVTRPEGRRAINATGILLHTGLGRAPLAKDAITALSVFDGYSILQTDLETGKRSLREEKIEKMLMEITGCEAATVVNNNAAATMLLLNTISEGREAIISRGQLVEIGGAFRMPDVMEKSGAIMHEIGTTNRTHLRDYEAAINENTGAVIHVHTSNYRVRGFGGTPGIAELCELKKQYPDLTVVDDIGSGALIPLSNYGLSDEPLVKESIAAGCDLACFSGDKLIGGAQSGIICGKKEWVQRIRKNPYARMFRVCKMTLAVLETALTKFVDGTYTEHIPFYRMLGMSIDELNVRAEKVVASLDGITGVDVIDELSFIGSGSIPDEGIPTRVVRVTPQKNSPNAIAGKLRNGIPSIFCRIKDGTLHFDMRTLLPKDVESLCDVLKERLVER